MMRTPRALAGIKAALRARTPDVNPWVHMSNPRARPSAALLHTQGARQGAEVQQGAEVHQIELAQQVQAALQQVKWSPPKVASGCGAPVAIVASTAQTGEEVLSGAFVPVDFVAVVLLAADAASTSGASALLSWSFAASSCLRSI